LGLHLHRLQILQESHLTIAFLFAGICKIRHYGRAGFGINLRVDGDDEENEERVSSDVTEQISTEDTEEEEEEDFEE
jgi:hypothetical protein